LGEEVPHIRFYKQKLFGNSVVYVIGQVANEDEDFVAVGFDQITSSLQYTVAVTQRLRELTRRVSLKQN